MLRRASTIFALVASSLLAGCANTNFSPDAVFDGHAGMSFWRLSTMGNKSIDARDALVIVEPYGNSITLSAPCGDTGYGFELKDGVFTRMMSYRGSGRCLELPTNKVFAAMISGAKRYRLADRTLTLDNADGVSSIALERIASEDLENRQWSIEYYFDGRKLVKTRDKVHALPPSGPPPPEAVFMFGRLEGRSGCGELIREYSPTGTQSTITISAGSLLTGFCYPDDDQLASKICDALTGERTIERNGDRLRLRDAHGTVQAILAPWHW